MAGAHRRSTAFALLLLLSFAGVATGRLLTWSTEPTPSATASLLVGDDMDENGCRASAGQVWCSSTSSCIRPWEVDCPDATLPTPTNQIRFSTGPAILPTNTTDDEGITATAVEPAVTPATGDSVCPGPAGLMGGWTQQEDPANDADVQAAAKFVLASLGLANQAFEVTVACTQVVAGTNLYLEVTLPGLGSVTAVVYQPLGTNAAMQITSLQYKAE
mmetsp:Transcript_7986/g.20304  ORF Transcript_7986/g.20304 Transcript_7986/m.20304 type:complete len:217 (-) Transcript_7986:44-694(-)